MVKGMARRVVVVKSPDKRVFEEAIFILRDDALRDSGVTAEESHLSSLFSCGMKHRHLSAFNFLHYIPGSLKWQANRAHIREFLLIFYQELSDNVSGGKMSCFPAVFSSILIKTRN